MKGWSSRRERPTEHQLIDSLWYSAYKLPINSNRPEEIFWLGEYGMAYVLVHLRSAPPRTKSWRRHCLHFCCSNIRRMSCYGVGLYACVNITSTLTAVSCWYTDSDYRIPSWQNDFGAWLLNTTPSSGPFV